MVKPRGDDVMEWVIARTYAVLAEARSEILEKQLPSDKAEPTAAEISFYAVTKLVPEVHALKELTPD